MRRLIIFAFTASASAVAAAQWETRPSQPIEDTALFSQNDYPDKAIRAEAQGLASISYEVGDDGIVVADSCRVTVTSGSAILDRQSCRIVEKRFRFRPALQDGKAVSERRSQSVLWRLPETPLRFDEAALRRLDHHLGYCVVKNAEMEARELIDAPLGGAEQSAIAKRLRAKASDCMKYLENLSPIQLADTAAEALMTKHFRGTGPRPGPDAPTLEARNAMEAFGQCVVRRDPEAVRELIDSEPTSHDETAATAKLVPHMTPCIDTGTTLTFSKAAIRALVAIALYRDAVHAASAQR